LATGASQVPIADDARQHLKVLGKACVHVSDSSIKPYSIFCPVHQMSWRTKNSSKIPNEWGHLAALHLELLQPAA